MKRRTLLIVASAIMLLSIPATGFGQDDYDRDWRDRNEARFYSHRVKQSVKRVDRLSGQLKNDVDRALDRSRLDGKSNEDRINDLVNDFHAAAAQFKDRFDDGRDPGRAEREARHVLDLGFQLDRVIERNRLSQQVESKWYQIMNDLRVIENVYNDERSSYYEDRDRY